jgi:hypothetical protein
MSEMCDHPSFNVDLNVWKARDAEGGPILEFKVKCAECGKQMQFVSSDAHGASPYRPMVWPYQACTRLMAPIDGMPSLFFPEIAL